ncbi:uncharacterized protein LOC141637704 [Silene latifolia]|uniref:uncharacterized protein LOC141637704 n=1 Tax=Silene latifolia TaxID=37657 RepID=UPI003D772A02
MQGIVQSVYQQVMKSLPDNTANSSLNFAGIIPSSHVNNARIQFDMLNLIVDIGASDYMTSNESLLHDIQLLNYPVHIGLPDGTIKVVYKAGKIRLNAHITLHNVLIVPDFKENLLSVGKLLDTTKLVVHFTESICCFQDLSSKVVYAVARKIAGLYRLIIDPKDIKLHPERCVNANVVHSAGFSCNANKTSVELLHARLGHTSKDKLCHVTGSFTTSMKDFFCEACALAKHHMLPDTCTWTYLMQNKQQAYGLITGFLSLVQTQFGVCVKVIRTDHGSEFVQDTCGDFFAAKGIVHRKSVVGRPRQSHRPRQASVRLIGYECPKHLLNSIIPAENVVHTSKTSSVSFHAKVLQDLPDYAETYVASLNTVFNTMEPSTYKQASTGSNWVASMHQELQALEHNQTWDLVLLPTGHKAIGSKWIFKVKHRADGSIERYKARLVAKSFNQVNDKDYKHTFSPIAKFTTVRAVLAIAVVKKWPLYQLDINNAFFHGYLEEEVYMKPPEGYTKAQHNMVCKLKKSIYGLKQASRQWNVELTKFLKHLGFAQSREDYFMFTKHTAGSFLVALVYVDDILLT